MIIQIHTQNKEKNGEVDVQESMSITVIASTCKQVGNGVIQREIQDGCRELKLDFVQTDLVFDTLVIRMCSSSIER